ncbi:MAG: M23 family metallopeptidase [Rickettsiales bacterium]|jgi:hypothetical protein|nr:M23 family metallopeptidase [Rickettsiales bacterium]
MDPVQMQTILERSGFVVLGGNGSTMLIEDPTCVLRSLAGFMDFAWIAISFLAGVMIFGWAWGLIRGARVDLLVNIRSLWIILAGLAAIPAGISFLLDQKIIQCDTINVSIDGVNKILALEKSDYKNEVIPQAEGFINEHRLVLAESILSAEDQATFRRVAGQFGLRIRGCEAMGCGGIGARRVDNGPAQHEGTDIVRRIGDPMPAMFDGTIIGIDDKYGGVLQGMTIRNDNGTTSYYGYVLGTRRVGDRLRAGDIAAYSQDLERYSEYRGVPNHTHFELWTGDNRSRGDLVNFQNLF